VGYSLLNAIIYDILWRLCDSFPSLRGKGWVILIMDHCFPDWVEWKTELTMKSVDKQTDDIREQWRREDNEKVREKFSNIFSESEVTTHDENTGAVLIEHPPDGSKAQDLLGGTMEIKSPWSLPEGK
jgi:hypothetical protein